MSEPARKLSAQDLVNATRQQMLKEVLEVVERLGEICEDSDLGDEVRIVDVKHALKEKFGDE